MAEKLTNHLVNAFCPPNRSPKSYLSSPWLKLIGHKNAPMRHIVSNTKLFYSLFKIYKKVLSIISALL